MSEIQNRFTLRQHIRRGIKKVRQFIFKERLVVWQDVVGIFVAGAFTMMLTILFIAARL